MRRRAGARICDAVVIAGVIADGKPPGRVAFLFGIAGFSGALVRNGGVRLRIQPVDLLRHSDGRFTSNFGLVTKAPKLRRKEAVIDAHLP